MIPVSNADNLTENQVSGMIDNEFSERGWDNIENISESLLNIESEINSIKENLDDVQNEEELENVKNQIDSLKKRLSGLDNDVDLIEDNLDNTVSYSDFVTLSENVDKLSKNFDSHVSWSRTSLQDVLDNLENGIDEAKNSVSPLSIIGIILSAIALFILLNPYWSPEVKVEYVHRSPFMNTSEEELENRLGIGDKKHLGGKDGKNEKDEKNEKELKGESNELDELGEDDIEIVEDAEEDMTDSNNGNDEDDSTDGQSGKSYRMRD